MYNMDMNITKQPRISLFIIVKNEERNLSKCIASARSLVSEIIVVDAFSKDKTVLRARELGAQVFQRKFDGFINQKNFALSKVSNEWALSLDADETLTPELIEEIKTAVQSDKYNGYVMMRTNEFLGKEMKHCGLKKEKLLRLVRTDKAKFLGNSNRDKLAVTGSIGWLKEPFVHHPYENLEKYFEKFNHYTTLSARALYEEGKHASVPMLLLRLPFNFLKAFVFRLGFLDGVRGLIWSVNSSFFVFTKYMKLWYLEQKNGPYKPIN